MDKIRTFIETGRKRTFAAAIDWPGWCRRSRDESTALEALLESGPRYQEVISRSTLPFQSPSDIKYFNVIERVPGSSTTDFGAPDGSLKTDDEPVNAQDLDRWLKILRACWEVFDEALQSAEGKDLKKGPRGGGRDPDKIICHVLDADQAYLRRLAWKYTLDPQNDPSAELLGMRRQIEEALENSCSGNLPESGPRGGKIWSPRFFIRRAAWHILDHTWEIEDRLS